MTAPACDRAWGDGQPCPADTPSRRRMVPKGPLVDLAAIHHCCIGGGHHDHRCICGAILYRHRPPMLTAAAAVSVPAAGQIALWDPS